MTATRDDTIERLRQTAARVAASHGLEVFDLQFRRESIGWVLRVVIDRPPRLPSEPAGDVTAQLDGALPAEEPVGIEDCQRVSHDLSALLDVDDALASVERGYTLEVSSPGLDRPLRGEADYRRFVGRMAKIVTREPVAGQSHFAGRLSGVEHGDVLIAEGRKTHRVPIDLVRRARLDVEF